ncbi:MAG: hypothetical protein RR224_11880 [Clostridia bacterium]
MRGKTHTKRLHKAIAVILSALFVLTLLPMIALADGLQPYESVEQWGNGVTLYHNKDGSEALDNLIVSLEKA